MHYPTLAQADLQGKRVLLRAGFDVPIEDGKVKDTTRVEANLDTMKFILDAGASLIIMAHQARPKAARVPDMSQKPLVPVLENLLGTSVQFAEYITSEETKEVAYNLQPGEVLLLENLRYEAGEKSKEESERDALGKTLASLADVYVNDAFTNSHRDHASMTSVPKCIPGFMGLNVQQEVEGLSKVLDNPTRPVTLVISGAKTETKVPVIESFLQHGQDILVGGIVANTLLVSSGREMTGTYDDNFVKVGKAILEKSTSAENAAIHIPVDLRGDNALDIGDETIAQYIDVISRSGTIVWNGPMGLFEQDEFAMGTKAICDAVVEATNNGAISIIGGGDTLEFLNRYGYNLGDFTYVSMAGGAMLDFISGKKLPALEALL